MAYGRTHAPALTALRYGSWLCDHWLVPAVLIVAFSPITPHVLMGEGEGCLYMGRRGFVLAELPDDQERCAFLRLIAS